jgi:hypothetical protein
MLLMSVAARDLMHAAGRSPSTVQAVPTSPALSDDCATQIDNASQQIIEDGKDFAGEWGIKVVIKIMKVFGSGHVLDKVSGIASSLLTIARLIATVAAFHGTITLDGGGPLVRTKSTAGPGAQGSVTATLGWDTGFSPLLGCMKNLFRAAGMPLSMPDDGPVKGGAVKWDLLSGGATGTGLGFMEFYDCAAACGQTTSDVLHMRTDQDGQSHLGVEGTHQQTDKSDVTTSFMRQAKLLVSYDPGDTGPDAVQAWKTLWGAFHTVLSGVQGDVVGVSADVIDNFLSRIGMYQVKGAIDVKDWGCPGGAEDGECFNLTLTGSQVIRTHGQTGAGPCPDRARGDAIETITYDNRADPVTVTFHGTEGEVTPSTFPLTLTVTRSGLVEDLGRGCPVSGDDNGGTVHQAPQDCGTKVVTVQMRIAVNEGQIYIAIDPDQRYTPFKVCPHDYTDGDVTAVPLWLQPLQVEVDSTELDQAQTFVGYSPIVVYPAPPVDDSEPQRVIANYSVEFQR